MQNYMMPINSHLLMLGENFDSQSFFDQKRDLFTLIYFYIPGKILRLVYVWIGFYFDNMGHANLLFLVLPA